MHSPTQRIIHYVSYRHSIALTLLFFSHFLIMRRRPCPEVQCVRRACSTSASPTAPSRSATPSHTRRPAHRHIAGFISRRSHHPLRFLSRSRRTVCRSHTALPAPALWPLLPRVQEALARGPRHTARGCVSRDVALCRPGREYGVSGWGGSAYGGSVLRLCTGLLLLFAF